MGGWGITGTLGRACLPAMGLESRWIAGVTSRGLVPALGAMLGVLLGTDPATKVPGRNRSRIRGVQAGWGAPGRRLRLWGNRKREQVGPDARGTYANHARLCATQLRVGTAGTGQGG